MRIDTTILRQIAYTLAEPGRSSANHTVELIAYVNGLLESGDAPTTTIYLARSVDRTDDDGQPLWWSNEGGWSNLGEALVFTEQERESLDVPYGGEWVRFDA